MDKHHNTGRSTLFTNAPFALRGALGRSNSSFNSMDGLRCSSSFGQARGYTSCPLGAVQPRMSPSGSRSLHTSRPLSAPVANRPLSPHLPLKKPQLSATFSISHRIFGVALGAAIISVPLATKFSLTNPDSLCASVMKAKYYPNCSVLEAEAKNGISYAWRSILKGIALLRKGVIKRVGDGTTVDIWNDPWLPRLWCRRPATPRGHTVITKACELIDPDTGSWDCELVKQTFWPQDASLILSPPIFEDLDDEWAWHFEEKGSFTVKSAYRLQRQLEDVDTSGQQGSLSLKGCFDWNAIWKLECPPKIKQFVWRIAHNSLPYRLNLVRKGMEMDPVCPMCNRMNEDGAHLFLKCKQVKACWKELQLEPVRELLMQCSGSKEFVTGILKLDRKNLLLVVSLLWWWWQARNKKASNTKRKLQGTVPCLARRSAAEFEQFFAREKKPKSKQALSWTPPAGDELKINIDGSFNTEKCSGGWGFIIRNANGEPVGAGAGNIEQAYDALQTEAAACLSGLRWARSWGMLRVAVETDSQKLVQAIDGSAHDLAVNGQIFREIKFFARLNFSRFSISYCPRACNSVADALATFGASSVHESPVVWRDDAPDFVRVLVASDFAVRTC